MKKILCVDKSGTYVAPVVAALLADCLRDQSIQAEVDAAAFEEGLGPRSVDAKVVEAAKLALRLDISNYQPKSISESGGLLQHSFMVCTDHAQRDDLVHRGVTPNTVLVLEGFQDPPDGGSRGLKHREFLLKLRTAVTEQLFPELQAALAAS